MSPPITPASSRLMVSPSPVPVCGCDTPSAPRSNGAKMRSRSCPDPGAGVDYPRTRDRAAVVHDELHAAGLREFQRIRQQVDQHLAQALFVGIDHDGQHRRPLENEVDALGGSLDAKHADELIEKFAQAHLVARQIEPARLDLGNVQNAVDQPRQMIGAAADHAHLVARFYGEAGILFQQLRIAGDGVQRRAQFVAQADHIAASWRGWPDSATSLARCNSASVRLCASISRIRSAVCRRVFPPRRAAALLRQHEQPRHHADDDGQREEYPFQSTSDSAKPSTGIVADVGR